MKAANTSKQQASSCEKYTKFLSRLYTSKDEFVKEYKKLCNKKTKAEFYLLVFSELEKAVSENNIDGLRKLNNIINYAYAIEDQVALKDYYNNANNPIRTTNLVILACKQNKLEILKYLFSNDSKILNKLSLNIERNTILPDNEDEECHNAFYYAIRSGNIKLLNTLINKWPNDYFTVHLEELDEILSKAYDELKLKNVLLSDEIEIFIEKNLINLRFFSNASKHSKSSKINLNNIKERIELILENINLLIAQYSNAKEKVDEKFLFVIKFIAQNIHILKQQLKSTYDRLPWEEVEFCLISFLSSHIKEQEINLFYHGILNKRKILNHLENFKKKLEDEKNNIEMMDINKIAELPNSKREDVIAEIINSYPEFEGLYNDYEQIKDIYSLEKINNFVKLALSVDPKEREGQLIITRVLQITGEYLKNTLESPHLSNTTSKLFLLSLPKTTRQIVIDLRNSFSHAYSLSKRTEIEDNMDINFFIGVQNDIKKVDDVITNILYNSKHKMIRIVLTKIVDLKDLNEMDEIVTVLRSIKLDEISMENFEMAEHEKLAKLIEKLNNIMTGKTDYEKEIFDKINKIIDFAKTKSEDITVEYIKTFMHLKCFSVTYSDNKINENILRGYKFFANKALENMVPPIESHDLKDIAELIMKIFHIVNSKQHDNLDEINKLIIQISYFVEFGINDIKWIKTLREKLNTKGSFIPMHKQMKTYNVTEKKYNNQLASKLSELKTILNDSALSDDQLIKKSSGKKNDRLKVVINMLVLDIMSVLSNLKNYLEHNLHFLDDNTPLLVGKCLRNHLAHDNALYNILLPDPSISVILNARKLTTEDIIRSKKKLGKLVKDDPSKLKNKHDKSLTIITNQKRMFVSLEEGNLESLKDCLKTGADIYARDVNLWTALHFAAKGPSLEVIKFILDCNISPNVKNSDDQNALHIAAAYGRTNIVKFFIQKTDLNIDDLDKNGKTPLHIAAQNGHKDTVEFLLKNNANADIKDIFGFPPLHSAVKNNCIDVTKILLGKEADVDVHESMSGFTLLHIAAENGYLEIVNFLLKNGANVNARSDREAAPLHIAALNGHLEVVNAMILNGADVNARVLDGGTALHYAVETGREKIANILLKYGANPNFFDKTYKNTPLHYAAKDGHVGIVKDLLKNKADANVATIEGITPLHFAVMSGHLEIVSILLKHDVNIHAKQTGGATPLHLAANRGYKEIVELLIQNGAKVNAKAIDNSTPLHAAVMHGNKDVTDLLIKNNAEVNVRDIKGSTPLHVAAMKGNKNVIDLLIKNKAEINARNILGMTPLHEAVMNDYENIVDLLIENGAEVNARSLMGLTPLHLAALHGHANVISSLIENEAEVNSKGIYGLLPLQSAVMGGHKDAVNVLIKHKAEINDATGNGLLHEAVETGNIEIIEILIRNGADVNRKNMEDQTPLRVAIKKNNKDIVKVLIANGADVNVDDGSLLSMATLIGNTDIVKLLLQNKARIEIKNSVNATPLHTAAECGHKDIVELLLANGADVNAATTEGTTPLHRAARNVDKEVVELLLSKGAEVNAESNGSTALHLAVALHGDIDVVRVLLDNGSDIGIKDDKNRTPLQLAAANNHLECVKALLVQSKKADINDKSNDNWTVLHIAAQAGNLEMVKYLVDEGCDVNARNTSGSKPIHIAAREGFTDVVEFFVNKGSSVHDLGAVNQTLLHYAAMKGQLEVVKYLISKGADINAQDSNGLSIMHIAANYGHENVIEVLLENGAVYNSVDKLDRKPLDMAVNENIVVRLASTGKLFEAVKCNNSSEVENHVKMGAFVNAKHTTLKGYNGTPLHYAAWKGYDKVVGILLQNKANPNITGDKGFTPLHYAAKFSHLKVVIILLSNGAVYDAVSDVDKTPLDFAVDTNIINLLKTVSESFRNVRNGNCKVINNLDKIKDLDWIKAIMRARNRENETLIVAAMRNNFPKVEKLKEVSQGNVSSQIDTALMYLSRGINEMSISILRNALKKRKEILGPDDPGTLDIQLNIAKALYKQGVYSKALNMAEEILQKRTDILGPNDEDTLDTRNLIGLIFYRQGRDKEALEIYEEIVEKYKEMFGPGHSITLDAQFHMALVLGQLKRYEEALNINETVFEKRKKMFGPNNHVTISAQNNIALVLRGQNKLDEALKIYKEVFEKKKMVLGINHSDTLRTFHNIAEILAEQKKYNEALKAYQDVLVIQKNVLGPLHPDTLNTQHNLGNLLFAQGKLIGALKVFNENFDERKAVLGPQHPSILDITVKLEAINLRFKSEGSDLSEVIAHLQKDINIAANHGDLRTVRNLLETGVDPNDNDMDGRTPLHFAVNNGHAGIVNVLLKHGADVTRATNKGNTPLHTAVSKGNKDIIEVLLQHVSRDKSYEFINAGTIAAGTTSLHVAAKNGSLDIVKTLLGHGAIYNIENKEGKTPFDISRNHGVNDLLGLVGTLFEDAKIGNVEIIDKLRALKSDEFSAVTNARNRLGMTLLQVVIFNKKKTIAAKLSDVMKSRSRTV